MAELSPYQHALQDITQSAYRFKQSLGTAPPTTRRPQQKPSPHHYLTIPSPQPITSLLVDRGFTSFAAEKLNRTYLDQVSSLKRTYETNHRQVIEQCLNNGALHVRDMDEFIAATHSAYISLYDQNLRAWQLKIDELSTGHTASTTKWPSHTTVGMERRPTFKNETVPLLEKSFDVNAYPSRVDKELLADETGMEYKQINIWFQNRRARSKKEGISLQRTATFATQLHTPNHSTISQSSMPVFADSCAEKRRTDMSKVHVSDLPGRSIVTFTCAVRPTYTFPTPYPPLYVEDPFPVRSGPGSFPTPWLRKCSIDNIRRRSPVDIDHLTIKMASLSLASDASCDYRASIPSFAFVPPRAPLPALIRTITASSRARPLTTLVSAAGSPTVSRPKETRQLYRTHPTRLPSLPIGRQSHPQSLSPKPISIPRSRTSATGLSRRSETRSPSPSYSSRSSSSSVSSRSTSSCSAASSVGPITPTSTSPHFEALAFVKDAPTVRTNARDRS